MQPDRSIAEGLAHFIDASPSPYHAVETARAALVAAGATELDRAAEWPATPGLYLIRHGGSLLAWQQGPQPSTAFRLIGAHTDSPNLRIKPQPDRTSAHFRQLGVEVYGGALVNSWLDRDLGLSGRLSVRGPAGPRMHLFRIDEPLLRVPQLAIHLHREIVTDGLLLNPQTHLAPVWDLDTERGRDTTFRATVAEAAGVEPDDILAWDAMTHDLTPSRRTGRNGVFLSAPRLDNLCSSFAAVEALIATSASGPGEATPVICLFDHEEVGSTSTTGADSTLVSATLERIVVAGGGTRDDLLRAMVASVCLSADMAHATHPNYVDRHEPDHHITLNGGVVIKTNVNQRYASDAETVGIFAAACTDAGVPVQHFVGRNDIPCGSTIGPISSARLGIRTVDVGVAQLAMHSARELAGADDPSYYVAAMTAFLHG